MGYEQFLLNIPIPLYPFLYETSSLSIRHSLFMIRYFFSARLTTPSALISAFAADGMQAATPPRGECVAIVVWCDKCDVGGQSRKPNTE